MHDTEDKRRGVTRHVIKVGAFKFANISSKRLSLEDMRRRRAFISNGNGGRRRLYGLVISSENNSPPSTQRSYPFPPADGQEPSLPLPSSLSARRTASTFADDGIVCSLSQAQRRQECWPACIAVFWPALTRLPISSSACTPRNATRESSLSLNLMTPHM